MCTQIYLFTPVVTEHNFSNANVDKTHPHTHRLTLHSLFDHSLGTNSVPAPYWVYEAEITRHDSLARGAQCSLCVWRQLHRIWEH